MSTAPDVRHNLAVGFERSVNKFPKHAALDVNNYSFTYADLSKMANVLKAQVKARKDNAQKLIGLFAYRSRAAYAGVLGVLGAGCGYVPLHPEFPTERIAKVIDLSMVSMMIVSQECQKAFDDLLPHITKPMTIVLADIMDSEKYTKESGQHEFIWIEDLKQKDSESLQVDPVYKEDIAYLLFTSGSTGEPKGVPVSHHNVRCYVEFITKRYDINEHDRCSQMHDMTFDFSIHDIYPTWETGACLCVANKEEKMFPLNYIQKNKLTCWASVPSIGVIIDKYGRLQPGVFPDLRYSFFCGEALYASMAEKWQLAADKCTIVNLYGPTETTMAISYYDWDSSTSMSQCVDGIVPLGRIFDGQTARVMETEDREAAVGQPGELCLSGSQVTKGYWHNAKQTQAQYVTFKDTGDKLWYKTGDLVKIDENACLFYLGRIDNQVKIQGNRVELGAIDKVLREASGVELAVSIPSLISAGNAESLIAFVCSPKMLDEKSILEHCRSKLPKYMVPSKVCFIEQMPMNLNGKIDRIQLQQMLKS